MNIFIVFWLFSSLHTFFFFCCYVHLLIICYLTWSNFELTSWMSIKRKRNFTLIVFCLSISMLLKIYIDIHKQKHIHISTFSIDLYFRQIQRISYVFTFAFNSICYFAIFVILIICFRLKFLTYIEPNYWFVYLQTFELLLLLFL